MHSTSDAPSTEYHTLKRAASLERSPATSLSTVRPLSDAARDDAASSACFTVTICRRASEPVVATPRDVAAFTFACRSVTTDWSIAFDALQRAEWSVAHV